MALNGSSRVILAGTGILVAVAITACSDSSVSPESPPILGPSTALGRWTPGPHDTCTTEIHDGHATRGPDGKLGVRGAGGGSVHVTMNISTPDVAGFRRSQSQIAAEMSRALQRGQRNL